MCFVDAFIKYTIGTIGLCTFSTQDFFMWDKKKSDFIISSVYSCCKLTDSVRLLLMRQNYVVKVLVIAIVEMEFLRFVCARFYVSCVYSLNHVDINKI